MLLKLLLFIICIIICIISYFYNTSENFTFWRPRVYDRYNQWGFIKNRYWVYGKNYYYPLSNNYNAIYQHLTPRLNSRMYRYVPY